MVIPNVPCSVPQSSLFCKKCSEKNAVDKMMLTFSRVIYPGPPKDSRLQRAQIFMENVQRWRLATGIKTRFGDITDITDTKIS